MKKFVALIMSIIVIWGSSVNVFASEKNDEEFYVVINDSIVIYEGEDYVNEETGEYFLGLAHILQNRIKNLNFKSDIQ